MVCIIKNKPKLILNAGLRAVAGAAGIYFLDFLLSSNGYVIQVGINEVTLLTNGLLGLPGFILLYGLAIYYTYR